MQVPESITRFLRERGGKFRGVIEDKLNDSEKVIATVIKTEGHYVMLICKANQRLDLRRTAKLLKRPLQMATNAELYTLLPGIDPGMTPPVPGAIELKAIVDPAVLKLERVAFPSGVPGIWVSSVREDFVRLLRGEAKVATITTTPIDQMPQGPQREREQILQKISRVEELPALPAVATQILKIKANPYATGSELVSVVEKDPVITAQILRYANSPLYRTQNAITTLDQAINRVMGFDFVVDLVMGLALGRSMQMEKQGRLGLEQFWLHALSCASLVQILTTQIDYARRPAASVGYLAGLLHNIGLLLLGDQFPEQFSHLNKRAESEKDQPLIKLEIENHGIAHTELGRHLMEIWNMPNEIVETVDHHHQEDYQSDYSIFANLVYIANRLLFRYQIGDENSDVISPQILERIGLNQEGIERTIEKLEQDLESLHFMAAKMVS